MLLGNVLAFGRLLRRLGIDVHPGRMLDLTEALPHVDLHVRDDVYHTCRALLVHRHEDLAVFDRAFDTFWGRDRNHRVALPRHAGADLPDVPDADGPAPGGARNAGREARPVGIAGPNDEGADAGDSLGTLRTWSDAEGLASKDFALFTEAELAVARAAMARLVWRPGARRTRRWMRGAGPRADIRRALQQSLRTGGDIVVLPRRRRAWRQRPVVLLCDVSGSMERYSRMLLHFAHAIGQRHRRVEAFLFSTRLTRITTALQRRGLDAAMALVARTVPDWSGGTRIGEALRELHVRWRSRVLHGGPVVLLISDGWDRGDPAVLGDQMARLQRNCHRLIWLNPLIGTEDYAPLTRGLQAALPFVDDFLPARTLVDLADLAATLNQAPGSRLQASGVRSG